MNTYKGTVTGGGTLSGGGINPQVKISDVVTENIAIDIVNSTFSGTEQQTITANVIVLGTVVSTISTTFSGPISGSIISGAFISTTVAGQSLTVTEKFANNYRNINISGSGFVSNLQGLSGPLTASGTVVVSGAVILDINPGLSLSGFTVSSGIGLRVLSGGTDIGATISNGGTAIVTSGGTDSDTIILKGGTEIVSGGGIATDATVSSGGLLVVSSGGLADPTRILTGGREIVSARGTDYGAQISGGTQLIFGLASGATAFSGTQIVGSGGTAIDTIFSGGSMIVSSGGTDIVDSGVPVSGVTVLKGGTLELVGGNTSGNATLPKLPAGAILALGSSEVLSSYAVSSGITLKVFSGGTDIGATISNGGTAIVTSGGTDSDAIILKGGTEIVSGGGIATDATVSSGGLLVVSSGGLADPTRILTGGREIVSARGTDYGAQISGGTQLIFGLASGATAFSGTQIVGSGGTAIDTIFSGGSMIVSSGGTDIVDSGVPVSGVTVLKGGTLELVGGNTSGNATLPKLPAGAILALGSSEVLSSYAVSSGITLKVFSGGTDIGATISNGGTAIVTSGGTDSDAIILKGGTEIVSGGGIATDATVSSGGLLVVSSGGLADPTRILTGGREIVSARGTDYGAQISGGTQLIFGLASGATAFSGTQIVGSGGTAIDTIFSGGSMIVSSGGTDIVDSGVPVSGVTVLKGGTLELVGGNTSGNATLPKLPAGAILALGSSEVLSSYAVSSGITLKVFSGGTDIGATISNGGTAIVTSGGTDSDAIILKGGTEIVSGGGIATDATVSSGGLLVVSSGGLADPTRILTGGREIVSASGTDYGAQISGGTQLIFGLASGATAFSGTQIVGSGGTAIDTIFSGGSMIVSSGGTDIVDSGVPVSGVTVLKGGTLELVGGNTSGNATLPKLPAGAILALGSSEVLSSYAVSSGITLKVFSGGTDIGATISNGGTAIVTSGGTDSDAIILKGGTEIVSGGGIATDATVSSGGLLVVSSGGLADPTRILTGGREIVSASGTDYGAQISGGTQLIFGLASGATAFKGGSEIVSAGGVAAYATVSSGGLLVVSSNGLALGETIDSGGTAVVSRGGTALNWVTDSGGAATIAVSGNMLVSGATVDMVGSLTNAGTLLVSSGSLTLSGTVSNSKLIETLAAGQLFVSGTILNSGGTLLASGAGSRIDIAGVVSGGLVVIGDGIVAITSGSERVTFLPDGTGGLEIADTQANLSAYAGKISGFGGVLGLNSLQFIDLVSVTFSSGMTQSYSASAGVLTVTSGGVTVATINVGSGYTTSSFHLSSDPVDSSTIITDPAVAGGVAFGTTPNHPTGPWDGFSLLLLGVDAAMTLAHSLSDKHNADIQSVTVTNGGLATAIALLGSYMATTFVTAGGAHGVASLTDAPQTERLPLLSHPRT